MLRMQRRESSPIWLLALACCWIGGAALAAGTPPPAPSGETRVDLATMVEAAQAAGKQFNSTQPQASWETSDARERIQALWTYGRDHRTTPDGSRATVAALEILSQVGRHAEVKEKIATLGIEEPLWSDVMWLLLQAGNFDDFETRAKWVIANGKDIQLNAQLWFTLGRYYRGQGQLTEAEAALHKAAESPDPGLAEAAKGAIYEMRSLNPGQPAPNFTAALLTGETLTLEKLRGKVAVFDFWGST